MNETVRFIESLPYAVSENLFITLFQTILLYAVIIFVFHGLVNKKRILLSAAFGSLFLFMIISSLHSIIQQHHKQFLYPHKTNDAIIIAEYNKCTVLTSDTSKIAQEKLLNNLNKYFLRHKISEVNFIHRDTAVQSHTFLYSYPLLRYLNKRLVIWDDNWELSAPASGIDYVIFENNPFLRFENLTDQFENATFVFTTNNNKTTINIWERLINDYDIPYVNMYKTGALSIKIK